DIGKIIADAESLSQLGEYFLAYELDMRRVFQVGEHDGELVSAQARHDVGLAHAAGNAVSSLHQQQVACIMPEQVVDLLESVEVDEKQCQLIAVAVSLAHFRVETVAKHAAIRQTGKRIQIRMAPDQLLGFLLGGDVRQCAGHDQ